MNEKVFDEILFNPANYKLQQLAPENLPPNPTIDERFFRELSDLQGEEITYQSLQKQINEVKPLDWLNYEMGDNGLRPWHRVFLTFCPWIPKVWDTMELKEQRRFFDVYWSLYIIHLASFSKIDALKLKEMLESGKVEILRNLEEVKFEKGAYSMRGNDTTTGKPVEFHPTHLFNATGLGHEITEIPLYRDMIEQGIISQHPLGGIVVEPKSLRVKDPSDSERPLHDIFAIGDLLRGHNPVTAGIPKVAGQTDYVSKQIVRNLSTKVNEDEEKDEPLAILQLC